MGTEWSFTASITHPDGTDSHVSMSVPVESATADVLECSEIVQMGAARAMSAYVNALAARERAARDEAEKENRRAMAILNGDPF